VFLTAAEHSRTARSVSAMLGTASRRYMHSDKPVNVGCMAVQCSPARVPTQCTASNTPHMIPGPHSYKPRHVLSLLHSGSHSLQLLLLRRPQDQRQHLLPQLHWLHQVCPHKACSLQLLILTQLPAQHSTARHGSAQHVTARCLR
jgi:hypothetical protein